MSDRLASAASGPVERFAVSGAGHNDFFLAGYGQINAALRRLLDTVARSQL
jgi:hypothetical protein